VGHLSEAPDVLKSLSPSKIFDYHLVQSIYSLLSIHRHSSFFVVIDLKQTFDSPALA
jgi:hypothetical protein